MAYINTKFVYIGNIFKSSITSLKNNLLKKQCELERKVLLQKLNSASHSLPESAYTMGGGPGYTAIKSGVVIYLIKCKTVNTELYQ